MQPKKALVSVQIGQIRPLGKDQVLSGFVKNPVSGRVEVHETHLEGDAQADLSVHGGVDKAVYGYCHDHYQRWLGELPGHLDLLKPGGFGENLTFEGSDETEICLGDIFRIGSTLLQVSQPRQPCFKLALYYGDPRMPKRMMQNGRCGWYYRVLEPGQLAAGDAAILVQRPNPNWSIARFQKLIVGKSKKLDEMQELADMPGLAAQWREEARSLLSTAAAKNVRLQD